MTFGEVCKALRRPTVYVRRLQSHLGLSIPEDDQYHDAYLQFLHTVVYLRVLGISIDKLDELWAVEKRLMMMLHADSSDSPTWYLDACGQKSNPDQRLLLSNYDLGVPLPSGYVQLELDFTQRLSDLFSPTEMGEDVLRQLGQYLRLADAVKESVRCELPTVRAATRWAARICGRMMGPR